jgi:hypothetical protein
MEHKGDEDDSEIAELISMMRERVVQNSGMVADLQKLVSEEKLKADTLSASITSRQKEITGEIQAIKKNIRRLTTLPHKIKKYTEEAASVIDEYDKTEQRKEYLQRWLRETEHRRNRTREKMLNLYNSTYQPTTTNSEIDEEALRNSQEEGGECIQVQE